MSEFPAPTSPRADRLSRGRRALLGLLALGAPLLGLALTTGACSSVPKGELELRLMALGKNRAVGSVERLPLVVDLGSGPEELELVYHHAPGPEGADPDRRPVVLIHGTPSTLFSWSEVIHGGEGFPGLAAERDIYALEVIGHGVAPGEADRYGFEVCARFIGAALEALELEGVHLVGSSYGGEFVWRTALNEPDRVASVTLVNSSGLERRDGDWLPEEVVMRDNPLAKIGWMLNSRERIEGALAPHFPVIPPDRVEEFFLVCENDENWHAMIDLARDENGDRAAELSSLGARTLVLWGEDDIAYPLEVYGQRFADLIPEAELLVFPGTGHYPHEQRPEEFIGALGEFFAGVESRP